MQEELIVALFMGFWMGAPTGWFLKSALTWRRDARKLAQTTTPPPVVAPPPDSRLEALMERAGRRLEAIEDRLEFTERILDARTSGTRPSAERRVPGPQPHDT